MKVVPGIRTENGILEAKGDALDKFLTKMEDPDDWRTLRGEEEDFVLTREELDIIQRIQNNEYADLEYNPYEPYVDFFTGKLAIHPVQSRPEPKSRFIPSKWEAKTVMKLVRAIRRGDIIPNAVTEVKPKFYAIWDDADKEISDKHHISAPKMKLPDHSESYNPPEEYLLTKEEEEEWLATEEVDRTKQFLPRKYDCMRHVPGYDRFIQERFSRCLDLYLCPRIKKNRLNIDPQSLIPNLPDPKDLKPFPTTLAQRYIGHEDRINELSLDASGNLMLSCSKDKTVKMWEVESGRCLRSWEFDEEVKSVSWNPNDTLQNFAVASGNNLWIIFVEQHSVEKLDSTSLLEWECLSGMKSIDGKKLCIKHKKEVFGVSWHRKGDYLVSLSSDSSGQSVHVHQISKQVSQTPFKKIEGDLQKVVFHPTKPEIIVASKKSVRIYNLTKQSLVKKLQVGVNWISDVAIHPKGDNLIVSSYDKKVSWFDLDLSNKPYKTLRFHKEAVRSVAFHKRHPLFATCSDDGSVNVVHGMVYQDLLQNPLIVPVKILKSPKQIVYDIEFHPHQPWIFACYEDNSIKLFT